MKMSLRELSLAELRQVPPIPSGFVTDTVFRLVKSENVSGMQWELREERLDRPFDKRYDWGHADEWLTTYEDAGSPDELWFLAADVAAKVAGILTWRPLPWNNTLWLVDIRVREEMRGQGIGATLIRRLQAVAVERGARGINVETQINNAPAIKFYRRLNFEIVGFNDHFYTNVDLETQDVALFLFWEQRTRG